MHIRGLKNKKLFFYFSYNVDTRRVYAHTHTFYIWKTLHRASNKKLHMNFLQIPGDYQLDRICDSKQRFNPFLILVMIDFNHALESTRFFLHSRIT